MKNVCVILPIVHGGLAEWSKAAVLKTVVPARVPGVRIPKPPPIDKSHKILWLLLYI